MTDKFKDEMLSEEQLDLVNGGIAKEIVTTYLDQFLTIIDSAEYKMLSDRQKSLAFTMMLDVGGTVGTVLSAFATITGAGDAVNAIKNAKADMPPDVRRVAERSLGILRKLADKIPV